MTKSFAENEVRYPGLTDNTGNAGMFHGAGVGPQPARRHLRGGLMRFWARQNDRELRPSAQLLRDRAEAERIKAAKPLRFTKAHLREARRLEARAAEYEGMRKSSSSMPAPDAAWALRAVSRDRVAARGARAE